MFSDPTPAELAATEREWPLIEAELAVVTEECRMAISADPLAIRAHRRAVARLDRVARGYVIRPSCAIPRPLVSTPDSLAV